MPVVPEEEEEEGGGGVYSKLYTLGARFLTTPGGTSTLSRNVGLNQFCATESVLSGKEVDFRGRRSTFVSDINFWGRMSTFDGGDLSTFGGWGRLFWDGGRLREFASLLVH